MTIPYARKVSKTVGGIVCSPYRMEVSDLEYDLDNDGYMNYSYGGDDCDDTKFLVNPGMPEIPNNGIDDDCDGEIDEEGCFIGIF